MQVSIVATTALLAAALVPSAAPAAPLHRPDDPIVLTGEAVPSLYGKPPSSIVAFRYADGWQQVPVQVDERVTVDLARPYAGSPTEVSFFAYADAGTYTGPDSNPALDLDDEIVFMARDSGAKVPAAGEPAGVVSGTGRELRVADSLDGGVGYLYLFEQAGNLDQAAGRDYVEYRFDLLAGSYPDDYDIANGPNPEDTLITTPRYRYHFSDRWKDDGLQVTAAGASGADILDRHKFMFAPGSCTRSEDTFSAAEGAFVVNRDGPVRALRSYMGANSGPYTQRTHAFYDRRQDIVTDLRVHQIFGGMDLFDYSPAASGMTYMNDFNGAPLDGSPESLIPGQVTWESVDGPQGGLSIGHVMATDIPGFTWSSYWLDDSTPGGGADHQCTGDAFAYGVSGPWMNTGIPNTDPAIGDAYHLRTTRHIYFESPGQANGAARRVAATTPPQVAVTPLAASYARPKGATPVLASLVPAQRECAAANRVHAPPPVFSSCAPPDAASAELTAGTPDSNGLPAGAAGTLQASAQIGNDATPADEADVRLGVSVSDVRRRSDLADYTGELDAQVPLRITDRGSFGPSGGAVPGTAQDLTLSFAVPCLATGSEPVGATCTALTSADALRPGTVAEGRRSIWELGRVAVYDGGPDGLAATAPNTPFMRQGVFVP
jgi:hypothetical protein